MSNIKFYGEWLTEGKIEKLSKSYSDELSNFEISALKSYSENSSVNFNWLLKNYTNDKLDYSDNIAGVNILLDVLDDYFKRYLRIKKNLPVDKRDINNIKSTKELISIIDMYNDYDQMLDSKNLDIIVYNEKWVVFTPKTYNSSKKWGWGRFCTSHDEDYFDYHNIKNKSLVYVMHKFDYTKNLVIECLPENAYKIWNYQDDNTWGSNDIVFIELEEINDGHLDVSYVVENLPSITVDDMKEHVVNLMLTKLDIENINQILNSGFNKIDKKSIIEHIEDNDLDLYEIYSDIRDMM